MEVSGKFSITPEMLHQILSFTLSHRRDAERQQRDTYHTRMVEETVGLMETTVDTLFAVCNNWDSFKDANQIVNPGAVARFVCDTLPDDFKYRILRLFSKIALDK